MKFGETFTEYLHGEQEWFLDKCSHVGYKQLKKVLKSCQNCRAMHNSCSNSSNEDDDQGSLELCRCDSCPSCDQIFFSELTKEASEVAGCFRSRVRQVLQLHTSTGWLKYMWHVRHCFANNHQAMIQEGRMLIEYVTMNAIALRKILKKYDKVHGSVNGRNFKIALHAKRVELLQSPWLIELGAFYLNIMGADDRESSGFSCKFSLELNDTQPTMILALSDSVKLEYNLICAVCLEMVFNPYALACGHLFCKLCACSAASVLLFQGPKSADPGSKCPVCRTEGVYADCVHMMELDVLVKNRMDDILSYDNILGAVRACLVTPANEYHGCKKYWKERLITERAETVRQSKEYWESQAKIVLGI